MQCPETHERESVITVITTVVMMMMMLMMIPLFHTTGNLVFFFDI